MTKIKNRIIGSGEEQLDQIMFNPRNWRIHPLNQQNALKGVLEEVGWVQQVIVNKRTGNLVDGHLRCQLAAREGATTIPVVYIDVSEDEEVLVLATLDPIAAMAATDKQKLDELFADIESENENVKKMLDEIAEKERLEYGKKPVEDVEPQIDKAEQLRVKWGVESGQLWQLGEHRLVCGDCTDKAVVERVMQGEVAGAVVTDPPYGMNLDTNFADIHKGHYSTRSGVHSKVIGDEKKFNRAEVAISAKEEFWWGADYYLESLETGGSWVVWDKTVGKHVGRIGNEFELCYSKKPHKRVVIRHYWVGFYGLENEDTAKREHPTQKPLEVIEVLLKEYVDEQSIIVDPYLGSGTTLIACERLGRKCRAVEISPAYCAVAIQRWVDATGGTPELME